MANKHYDDYDYAFEETERKLALLENRIYRVYKEASEDMGAKTDQYFEYLEVRDKEMRELVMSGGMTEQHYRLWREAQIGRGERMAALRDELAQRAVRADAVAMAYVRDETPGIYSLNYNYTAYTIEQVHGNIGFTLYDEQTVRRLLQDDPDILPMPELDEEYDFTWNRTKMQDAITSGILQGESFGKIATRLQHVANMDRTAALRNARTALTTAQNAGRQASIERATRMGIYLRKRWIAIKDGRTRHTHGKADGQIREVDEYFDVGSGHMMYPGDIHGPAKEVYNCRCSMRTVEKDGIEAEPRKMRVVDPESGETLIVNEMTYKEWVKWKGDLQQEAGKGIIKAKLEKGEISTKLSIQQYDKHILGTKKYEEYYNSRVAKGRNPQSILTISEKETQRILNECVGTGKIDVARSGEYRNKEFYDVGYVIGQYYDHGEYKDTTRVAAHYSKKGAHLVPVGEEVEYEQD